MNPEEPRVTLTNPVEPEEASSNSTMLTNQTNQTNDTNVSNETNESIHVGPIRSVIPSSMCINNRACCMTLENIDLVRHFVVHPHHNVIARCTLQEPIQTSADEWKLFDIARMRFDHLVDFYMICSKTHCPFSEHNQEVRFHAQGDENEEPEPTSPLLVTYVDITPENLYEYAGYVASNDSVEEYINFIRDGFVNDSAPEVKALIMIGCFYTDNHVVLRIPLGFEENFVNEVYNIYDTEINPPEPMDVDPESDEEDDLPPSDDEGYESHSSEPEVFDHEVPLHAQGEPEKQQACSYVPEIPLRDDAWVKQTSCPRFPHKGCRCWSRNDWKNRLGDDGLVQGSFYANMFRFVAAADCGINLMKDRPAKEKAQFRNDLKSHPYITYLCHMQDQTFGPITDKVSFFKRAYRVREYIAFNGNYGYRECLPEFEAQAGDDDLAQGGFLESIKNIFRKTKETYQEGGIKSVLKSVFDKIVDSFKWLFTLISDKVSSVFDWIKGKLFSFFLSIIAPEWIVKFHHDESFRMKTLRCLVILVIVFAVITGIVAYATFSKILSFITGEVIERCEEKFFAQADINPIAVISSICIGVFGLSKFSSDKVQKTCRTLISICAGGTVVATGLSALFLCLPVAFQESVIYAFCSEKKQKELDAQKWFTIANALIIGSKTPSLVRSPYFVDRVAECLKEGQTHFQNIPDRALKARFAVTFAKILSIQSCITQKKNTGATRDEPFSIHIFGPPGVGKTIFHTRFIKDITELREEDIYHRQSSDEYWSGFQSHKAVVFDEFLVGDPEVRSKIVHEYLDLVGSATFMPNMASVDNANVGIKGDIASPEIVVTMNNTAYDVVNAIPEDAIFRRRDCVVRVRRNEDGWRGGDKLDAAQYTVEEFARMPWLHFQILNCRPVEGPDPPFIDYETLCDYFRAAIEHHGRKISITRAALGEPETNEKTPEQVFDEILRDCFKVPSKPMGVLDSIMTLIGFGPSTPPELHAQGGKKKKRSQSPTQPGTSKHSEFGTFDSDKETEPPTPIELVLPEQCSNGTCTCCMKLEDFSFTTMKFKNFQCDVAAGTPLPQEDESLIDIPPEPETPQTYSQAVSKTVTFKEAVPLPPPVVVVDPRVDSSNPQTEDETPQPPPPPKVKLLPIDPPTTPILDPSYKKKLIQHIKKQKPGSTEHTIKRHTHKCCGKRYKHSDHFRSYKCSLCGKYQFCEQYRDLPQYAHTHMCAYCDRPTETCSGVKALCPECNGYVSCPHFRGSGRVPGSDDDYYDPYNPIDCWTHKGVDPNTLHLHTCIFPACHQSLTHSHAEHAHEPFLCDEHSNYQYPDLTDDRNRYDMDFAGERTDNRGVQRCPVSGCENTWTYRDVEEFEMPKSTTGPQIVFGPTGCCWLHCKTPDTIIKEYEAIVDKQTQIPGFIITETPVRTCSRLEMNQFILSCYENRMSDYWNQYADACKPTPATPEQEANCEAMKEEGWKKHLKNIFWSLSASTAIWIGVFALANWLGKSETQTVTFHEQTSKNTKNSSYRRNRPKFRRGYIAQSEAEGYTARLCLNDKEAHCILIGGKWVLVYAHFFRSKNGIPEGAEITLLHNSKKYTEKFVPELVIVSEEVDLAFYLLQSKTLPSFKNIHKLFPTESDLEHADQVQCIQRSPQGVKYFSAIRAENVSYTSAVGPGCHLNDAWRYHCKNEVGDCGLPMIATAGALTGKILGIHVAGSGNSVPNPQGISTIITREDLKQLEEPVSTLFPDVKFTAQGPIELSDLVDLPNCAEAELLPSAMQHYIPSRTKFTKSVLFGSLENPSLKAPAIMHENDPRSQGLDPVAKSLTTLLNHTHPEVEQGRVNMVYSTMLQKHKDLMVFPVGLRELTFEEAIMGVPGKLTSIRTSTSAGYPLSMTAVKKGKKDFFYFEPDGTLRVDGGFRELVFERLEQMEKYEGGEIGNMFQGFLKDELVTGKKIMEVRTRMTFCNDLVSMVAFRMKFGALLAAFNSSSGKISTTIGINQYSHDMNIIYQYLTQVGNKKFIAGDYKAFDQRQHPVFRDAAYKMLGELAKMCGVSQNCINYMIQHETRAWLSVRNVRVKTVGNHMSGCFWTTTLNCLVNEGYFRYLFSKRFPTLYFDQECRLAVHGDDNVLSESEDIEWTPRMIEQDMLQLGQTYTNIDKDKEVSESTISFEEITFLGAIPREIPGGWTGALKKETLFESLQWTTNKNITIIPEIIQMVELASQWDHEFYVNYVTRLRSVCNSKNLFLPYWPGYEEMQQVVASRTANTGSDFPTFHAQGPPELEVAQVQVDDTPDTAVEGMTAVETSTQAESQKKEDIESFEIAKTKANQIALKNRTIQEKSLDLSYGTNSIMYRAQFEWTTNGVNAELGAIDLPYGILAFGDPDNLQNMAFQRFLFTCTDLTVILQMSGTPFHQGLLAVYFYPLSTVGQRPSWADIPANLCQTLAPNDNSTKVLKIPFKYFRSCLSNVMGSNGFESVGTLRICVLSPLQSVDGTAVTITLSSSFDASFTIPRPAPADTNQSQTSYYSLEDGGEPIDLTRGILGQKWVKGYSMPTATPCRRLEKIATGVFLKALQEQHEYHAQGNTFTNTYNQNTTVIGDGPVESAGTSTVESGQTSSVDTSLDATIPMDNPSIAGGALPIMHQFPSLSKTMGYEPTVGLQLNQSMMHREAKTKIFNGKETCISTLLQKPCLFRRFTWKANTAPGTALATFRINSLMNAPSTQQFFDGFGIPFNIGLLNCFQFVKFDVVIDFQVIKTGYHSGRLQATAGYAQLSNNNKSRNVYLNKVYEFNQENCWGTLVVPYNCPYPYMKTYQGPSNISERTLNSHMGQVTVYVANSLKAPSTVAQEVDVLCYVYFTNVRVYEANPEFCLTTGATRSEVPYKLTTVARAPPQFHAQGGHEDITPNRDLPVSVAPEGHAEVTRRVVQTKTNMCRLELGAHFEYGLTDVHELARRARKIQPKITPQTVEREGQHFTYFTIIVEPTNAFRNFYAGWSGHMKYRIFYKRPDDVKQYDPVSVSLSALPTDKAGVNKRNIGLAQQCFPYDFSSAAAQIPGAGFEKIRLTTNLLPIKIPPQEIFYPLNTNLAFIDIMVPMNTHAQFLSTVERSIEGFSNACGAIVVRVPGKDQKENVLEIYESMGDDAVFGIFRPPPGGMFWQPFSKASDVQIQQFYGEEFLGWRFPTSASEAAFDVSKPDKIP